MRKSSLFLCALASLFTFVASSQAQDSSKISQDSVNKLYQLALTIMADISIITPSDAPNVRDGFSCSVGAPLPHVNDPMGFVAQCEKILVTGSDTTRTLVHSVFDFHMRKIVAVMMGTGPNSGGTPRCQYWLNKGLVETGALTDQFTEKKPFDCQAPPSEVLEQIQRVFPSP